MPLVAPPIASFTPPLLIRLTDAPLPPRRLPPPKPPLPPIAVPDTVTVPPFAELPKTAGPRPPLERVAEPADRQPELMPAHRHFRLWRWQRLWRLVSNTGCLGIRATPLPPLRDCWGDVLVPLPPLPPMALDETKHWGR